MDIYKQALMTYGVGHQLTKLAEEAAELAVASLHLAGGRVALAEVAEEAADIEIMLSQLRLIMGDQIDEHKRSKLTRLRLRLGRDWKVEASEVVQGSNTVASDTHGPSESAALDKPIDADPGRTHVRYVCQCGQSVRVQQIGDGYDAVLEIPCPLCGARMRPEVDNDKR